MSVKSFLIPKGEGSHKKAWLFRAIVASGLLICAAQLPGFIHTQNYYLHLRGAWLFGSPVGGPAGHHAILLGMGLQLMIEVTVFYVFKKWMPNTSIFYRALRLALLAVQALTMLIWLTWVLSLLADPSTLPGEEPWF